MGILKGFAVKVVWHDGSYGTTELKSQNSVKAYINGLDLTEVRTVTTWPVWSKLGEAVPVEVHHQR